MMSRFGTYRLILTVPTILASLLLASCMSVPEVMPDHFYRLAETWNDASLVQGWPEVNRIAVAQPEANGIYQSRNLLYVNQDKTLEVHRYHRQIWTAAPTQLIQEHMMAYFRKVLPQQQIMEYQPGSDSDLLIRSRLVRFEQVNEVQSSYVVVVLELSWSRAGVSKELYNRRYTEQVPINPPTPYAVARGLSEALTGIYAALLKDIAR